jgi:hypothetical protein
MRLKYYDILLLTLVICNISAGTKEISAGKLICSFKMTDGTHAEDEKVVILSLEKKYDTTSHFWTRYSTKCQNWELSNKSIYQIIKYRRKIDSFQFHYFYDVLPCFYEGYVLVNDVKYHIIINPGAFLVLSKNGHDIYYNCTDKHIQKYFVSMPASEETM